MKLGGQILAELFQAATWRAYRGDDLLSWAEIEPLIGPNSIDVTLGDMFLTPHAMHAAPVVDPRDAESLQWSENKCDHGGCIPLLPNEFMLGSVRERFVCDAPVLIDGEQFLFAPMYEGRSSCGRLGLASHVTAGFGDHGFCGAFTLELKNHFPYGLLLYPGMRIGQVAFEQVHRPERYQGAYNGVNHYQGPVPPKLGKDRF